MKIDDKTVLGGSSLTEPMGSIKKIFGGESIMGGTAIKNPLDSINSMFAAAGPLAGDVTETASIRLNAHVGQLGFDGNSLTMAKGDLIDLSKDRHGVLESTGFNRSRSEMGKGR